MSKPEFVYVTYIETTPEKLFQALTVERILEALLVRHRTEVGLESRLAVGAGDGRHGDRYRAQCLNPIRPRRLSYTFQHESATTSAQGKAVEGRLRARAVRQARQADADP